MVFQKIFYRLNQILKMKMKKIENVLANIEVLNEMVSDMDNEISDLRIVKFLIIKNWMVQMKQKF